MDDMKESQYLHRLNELERQIFNERNEKALLIKKIETQQQQIDLLMKDRFLNHPNPNKLGNLNGDQQFLNEFEDVEDEYNVEEINKFLAANIFNKIRDHNIELEIDSMPGIKEQITEFFIKRAEAINDIIDVQLEIEKKMQNTEDENTRTELKSRYDAVDNEISESIKKNYEEFDHSIRYLIQDYLILSKQEIDNLKFREHELIEWCSNLFESVCIDKKE